MLTPSMSVNMTRTGWELKQEVGQEGSYFQPEFVMNLIRRVAFLFVIYQETDSEILTIINSFDHRDRTIYRTIILEINNMNE